jgi:ABC-type antimicrobial peptide transport system permease subunit
LRAEEDAGRELFFAPVDFEADVRGVLLLPLTFDQVGAAGLVDFFAGADGIGLTFSRLGRHFMRCRYGGY